jgi:hypothetical protein
MAGSNIKDRSPRTKVQMLKQRFREGSRPIVVDWEGPTKALLTSLFDHQLFLFEMLENLILPAYREPADRKG